MKIRNYTEKDHASIMEFAERNNVEFPAEGKIILAEDDNGNIKAFCNIRQILMIEPFVSENPLAGKKLWDEIELRLKVSGTKIVRCFAGVKNSRLFKKFGFYRVFEGLETLEKNYWRQK